MSAIGVQKDGSSPQYVKQMATGAVRIATGERRIQVVADIGGGSGEWSKRVATLAERILLLDYAPPQACELPANV